MDRPPNPTPAPPGAQAPSAYEARVLRAFVADGRLRTIPAQLRKRQVVLRYLARTAFEPGEAYTERDVNVRLAIHHPDVAALRRELVDHGYLERPGGVYRLLPQERWPAPERDPPDRDARPGRPDVGC